MSKLNPETEGSFCSFTGSMDKVDENSWIFTQQGGGPDRLTIMSETPPLRKQDGWTPGRVRAFRSRHDDGEE